MDYAVWSVILLLVAVAIVGIELFVPSGGALGVLATVVIVASIVCGFLSSMGMGVTMILVTAIVVPMVIVSALKWWPHTPIGRRILVPPPEHEDDVLPGLELRQQLRSLVGRRGIAKTLMVPSGIVVIDGRSYDAAGEGTAIEPGQTVKVTGVDMNRLVVQLAEDDLGPPPVAARGDDLLSRPIESLGLESLDERGSRSGSA